MVEIEKQLKSLRLDGMLATLESRALQANQGNVAFIEALSCCSRMRWITALPVCDSGGSRHRA